MNKKARTPIIEYEDVFVIQLPGDHPPHERDHLTDQAMIVAYDRKPGNKPRWRLREIVFDRAEWTRSGIRRWWAEHEVVFLALDQLDDPVPEICRAYHAQDDSLPTIVLSHRNTPLVSARRQIKALSKGKGPDH